MVQILMGLEYHVKGELSDNTYKVRITLMPALWTQAASTRFPSDRCAQLVSNCNCMDSVYKGPVCKHAAACLLVEHRVMKKGLFDECPQMEFAAPSKKGKWLLSIFGALKEKRLVEF